MDAERLPERMTSLENRLIALETQLGDLKEGSLQHGEKLTNYLERIARLEERVSHVPTNEQAARLEERIARLPTTPTILATASILLAILIPFLTYLPRIQAWLGLPVAR